MKSAQQVRFFQPHADEASTQCGFGLKTRFMLNSDLIIQLPGKYRYIQHYSSINCTFIFKIGMANIQHYVHEYMGDDPERKIIHRDLDTNDADPASQLASIVAELEEIDETELPPMWQTADHVLDNLFSIPPDPDAQMEVEFSYANYRISVEQNGTATFILTEEPP